MAQAPLEQLLNAKESIHTGKQQLVQQYNLPVVSLALNIAGWPKSDKTKRKFFFDTLSRLMDFFYANRLFTITGSQRVMDTAAGLSFMAAVKMPENAKQIKCITEQFENQHTLGRFIDVDVNSATGDAISSEKEKPCFFCGQYPALDCMRSQRHSLEELKYFQQQSIQNYLKKLRRKEQSEKLTELTMFALLSEASLEPKPGLVSPADSGSHQDMDYSTFIKSISALTPLFADFYSRSLKQNDGFTMAELRTWGIRAEKKMLEASRGINTHKGAIFLMLLAGNVMSELVKKDELISPAAIQEELKAFRRHISKDITQIYEPTHGNKIKQAFPEIKAGIRQQVIDLLPAVFNAGIEPLFVFHYSPHNTTEHNNFILKLSLLSIMEQNADSNVIHRGSPELLKTMQTKAGESKTALLNGQNKTYSEFCRWTKNNNLSPGGSADLLALTIFIYLCSINPLLKPYEF